MLRVQYVVNGADSVQRLCELLRRLPLDRRFEAEGCGAFAHSATDAGWLCVTPSYARTLPASTRVYHGNFATYSAAFRLLTDEADLIGRLDGLIAVNRQRSDYRSQPVPDLEADERARQARNLEITRYRGGA